MLGEVVLHDDVVVVRVDADVAVVGKGELHDAAEDAVRAVFTAHAVDYVIGEGVVDRRDVRPLSAGFGRQRRIHGAPHQEVGGGGICQTVQGGTDETLSSFDGADLRRGRPYRRHPDAHHADASRMASTRILRPDTFHLADHDFSEGLPAAGNLLYQSGHHGIGGFGGDE